MTRVVWVWALVTVLDGRAQADLLGDVEEATAAQESKGGPRKPALAKAGRILREAQTALTPPSDDDPPRPILEAQRRRRVVAEKLSVAARVLDGAKLTELGAATGGLAAFYKGDAKKAIAKLGPPVVKRFPAAQRTVGLALLQLGDRDAAYSALQGASLPPTDTEALVALGKLATTRRDYDTARAAYGAAFGVQPTNTEAGAGLARAQIASGRANEAVEWLSSLAADPRNKEAIYLLGVAAARSGDRARAEQTFGRLVVVKSLRVSADPSYARAGRPLRVLPLPPPWADLPDRFDEWAVRTWLASALLQRGDHEGAIASLKGANRGEALYVRGLANLRAGAYESARIDLARATELEPKRLEPRLALGAAQLERNDPATAQETLEFNGNDPASLVCEAAALVELGRAADAEANLTKLAREKGAVGDAAATNLAVLRRNAGRFDSAWKTLPEQPLTAVGWLVRGLVQLDRKVAKQAVPSLRTATELQPNFLDAWVALARTLESANDDLGARQAVTRALELSPTSPEALAIRARLDAKPGRRAAAGQ